MSIEITVHHFANSNGGIPTNVIDSAKALVQAAALDSTVWRLARHRNTPTPGYHKPNHNSFLWARIPPHVQRQSNPCSLPDWNASPLLNQIPLCPLSVDEFESTDFSKTFSSAPRKDTVPFRRSAIDILDTNLQINPYKRARLHDMVDYDVGQPHYLDVPFPTRLPPKDIEQIPDFPIARSLVSFICNRPCYARTAWIIPLHGSLPLDGASAAQPCTNPSKSCSNIIFWNRFALSQFWTFLSQQRINHHFGPLSFGYIYSPSKEKLGSTGQTEMSGLMEYIKIYHDAKYAMKLRSSLDSFRWNDPSFLHAGITSFYRIFKGKQLVLVDETCKPILLA